MLVYANRIDLTGRNPAGQVLRAISRWVGEKVEARVSIPDLVTGRPLSGPRGVTFRGYAATDDAARVYSWILKHPDRVTRGRQWITELGLRDYDNRAEFTCVVKTDELSTLVQEAVSASRPRLIRFLLDCVDKAEGVQFAGGTPGTSLKWVGDSHDSYRGLDVTIRDSSRECPLVLVSPFNDGTYAVDPESLQSMLFGLAQVVGVRDGFDTYDMEEVLGRRYAAWGGALNIIKAKQRDGRVFSRLVRPPELEGVGEGRFAIEQYVLGLVTHATNVTRVRASITPERVRALAMQQRLQQRREAAGDKDESLKELLEEALNENTDLLSQLDEAGRERDTLQMTILEKDDRLEALDDEIRRLQFRQDATAKVGGTAGHEATPGRDQLLAIAASSAGPTPREVLECISAAYPGQIVILDSAIASADEVSEFEQGRRLLDMLRRLVTEYLHRFCAGGDNEARTVFTSSEYAAQESETVTRSAKHMRFREFSVDGESVVMVRHLKIGVADDPKTTIRVHFHVDTAGKRVLIGHCGRHLPLPSHK